MMGCGGGGSSDGRGGERVASAASPVTQATGDTIEVWKDPSCGCCKGWVDKMREAGFTVIVHDTSDVSPVKQAHGVGSDLVACHTAMVHGYVIEGHVPADAIRRLIAEAPKITGLAVPGMPMGSPGMEGGARDAYDVIAFTADGKRNVYMSK
jgi:hypothetical protein